MFDALLILIAKVHQLKVIMFVSRLDRIYVHLSVAGVGRPERQLKVTEAINWHFCPG